MKNGLGVSLSDWVRVKNFLEGKKNSLNIKLREFILNRGHSLRVTPFYFDD
jgi:hypothetical protein